MRSLETPLVLEKLLVHRLTHHHLSVELDQEILGLLTTHLLDLRFEGAQIELLLERELHMVTHKHTNLRNDTFGSIG